MAVSFTLVDLKFLDQQSQFSLTLQPLRATLVKVTKLINSIATTIPFTKCSWLERSHNEIPCNSHQQDLRRLRKYCRLEVQLAYLVDFVQLLPRFASHFYFYCIPNQSYSPLDREHRWMELMDFHILCNKSVDSKDCLSKCTLRISVQRKIN